MGGRGRIRRDEVIGGDARGRLIIALTAAAFATTGAKPPLSGPPTCSIPAPRQCTLTP